MGYKEVIPMAFTPKVFDSGKVLQLPLAANAVAKRFGHVKMSSGYLVEGQAGDNEAEYISLETTTDLTGVNAGTYISVIPVDQVIELQALTDITPVQATHVGTDVDFADDLSLALGSTTDKIFHIDSIVSAADKIVAGRFNKPGLA